MASEQGFFKRRPRPSKDMVFDYKDVEMLSQFTSPGGKIVAARRVFLIGRWPYETRDKVHCDGHGIVV